ncbi:hypothetical protein GLA29479_867 [Lysobacter antibioticus]|uniref:hypothetical protein n=1 Tax=Lysobacter antibioticus TaxID=84531 RepID=UPI000720AAC3|nr:hypothetical protein [Lysobacter antibioticus]ALN61751.1 hypothetical protein GLA29479_867 [Lysobacter antibioticus]
MNPAPADPDPGAQARASVGRPARNDFRGTGRWLMWLAVAVMGTGLVTYRAILGESSDGLGLLGAMVFAITAFIGAPLGLIGIVLWLFGVARARRTGGAGP